MGVKSTKTLTRAEAERRYVDLWIRTKAEERRAETQDKIDALGDIGRPYMRDHDLHEIPDAVVVELFHHLESRMRRERWMAKARTRIAPLTDEQLENELERLNDEANSGEGCENYIIEG